MSWLIKVKMAVLAPMPSASERMAIAVKPGLLRQNAQTVAEVGSQGHAGCLCQSVIRSRLRSPSLDPEHLTRRLRILSSGCERRRVSARLTWNLLLGTLKTANGAGS